MKKIFYFMAILFAFASYFMAIRFALESCLSNYDGQNEIVQCRGVGSCGGDGIGRSLVMRDQCVVITIDSCEYLYIGNLDRFTGFTGGRLFHKDNCKYCAERRKRIMKNLK